MELTVLEKPQAKLQVFSPTQVSFSSSAYIKTMDGHDEYDGEYIIMPSTDPQVLPTEGKVMAEDLTVQEIPAFETDNEAGGRTFIIAS